MKLTTSAKLIGILAAGLVCAFGAAADINQQNIELARVLPIICEFDESRPMCRSNPPPPYCASVNGCEADSPKEVCLDYRDRPGICLTQKIADKNYLTFNAKRSW